MLTLRSLAMKPMTEKMTNPAKMLVALLVQVTINVSLEGRDQSLTLGEFYEWEGTEKDKCGPCVSMCMCVHLWTHSLHAYLQPKKEASISEHRYPSVIPKRPKRLNATFLSLSNIFLTIF